MSFYSSFTFAISFATMPEIKNTATKLASQESQSTAPKCTKMHQIEYPFSKIFRGDTPGPPFSLGGEGRKKGKEKMGGMAPPLPNPGSAPGWWVMLVPRV